MPPSYKVKYALLRIASTIALLRTPSTIALLRFAILLLATEFAHVLHILKVLRVRLIIQFEIQTFRFWMLQCTFIYKQCQFISFIIKI